MNRKKMPIPERAKQFAPYAALPELSPTLRRIESNKVEERIELSDYVAAQINDRLLAARVGMQACVRYYDGRRYVAESGRIGVIDPTFQTIKIDGKLIFMGDIAAIYIDEEKSEKSDKL